MMRRDVANLPTLYMLSRKLLLNIFYVRNSFWSLTRFLCVSSDSSPQLAVDVTSIHGKRDYCIDDAEPTVECCGTEWQRCVTM